jgi:hypothetical protein
MLPFKYVYPLATALALIVGAREWRTFPRDRSLRLCAAFGLAGFIGCFPRCDAIHIAFTTPLACPLLAYCAARLCEPWRPVYRYIFAAAAIGLCVASGNSLLSKSEEAMRQEITPTPRGAAAFMWQPEVSELVSTIAATSPQDAYFFYPYLPMLPFLTAREQVSKYDIFIPNYTLPFQYRDACMSVMQRAAWVVIDRPWTDFSILKQVFPAMRGDKPQETATFEQALESGFELAARDGPFELRRRKVKGVDVALCGNIRK